MILPENQIGVAAFPDPQADADIHLGPGCAFTHNPEPQRRPFPVRGDRIHGDREVGGAPPSTTQPPRSRPQP